MAVCDTCAAIERARQDDPRAGHATSCLVWGLPNPKPEDCDCWDGCEDSDDTQA
jgi:hypothetical protein